MTLRGEGLKTELHCYCCGLQLGESSETLPRVFSEVGSRVLLAKINRLNGDREVAGSRVKG